MKSRFVVLLVIGVFLMNIFGCASIPQEHQGAATGAGIGAATGALAGAIVGRHAESIVIGGLLGALVGGAIGHYAVDQKRTAQETNSRYNYQSSGIAVRIEDTSAHPTSVRAGDKVELRATYALLGLPADGRVDLLERREISRDGQIVGNPEVTESKGGGTYTSTVPLFLPADAAPGKYTVRTTIQAGNSSDTRETTFHVK